MLEQYKQELANTRAQLYQLKEREKQLETAITVLEQENKRSAEEENNEEMGE